MQSGHLRALLVSWATLTAACAQSGYGETAPGSGSEQEPPGDGGVPTGRVDAAVEDAGPTLDAGDVLDATNPDANRPDGDAQAVDSGVDASTAADGSSGSDAASDAAADAGPDAQSCEPGADSDGDGLSDCEEQDDGDPWTSALLFNGVHVRWANQCGTSGSCNQNDTRSKASTCMQTTIEEEKDQYAGWDWTNPPDDLCNAGYGFAPNWSRCDNTWQAEWSGYISFAQAGTHCFAIAGSSSEGCASLFFDQEDQGLQTGQAARCFARSDGVYPILWHYTMDNGSSSSMHLLYCFDPAAPCTPSVALPSRLLRPQWP